MVRNPLNALVLCLLCFAVSACSKDEAPTLTAPATKADKHDSEAELPAELDIYAEDTSSAGDEKPAASEAEPAERGLSVPDGVPAEPAPESEDTEADAESAEATPASDEASDEDRTYLLFSNIISKVVTREGKHTTVRFSILIGFAGSADEQTAAIELWDDAASEQKLTDRLKQVMGEYTLNEVSDASFTDRFEARLLIALNEVTQTLLDPCTINFVQVTKLSWD